MPTALNPYLFFNGDAAEAIALYERALGAKVEGLQRYGDVPGTPPDSPDKDKVIHAALHLGEALMMVSDAMAGHPVGHGGEVQVCLNYDDVTEMRARFDALAAGGKVTSELQDTFWGATFGTLTDAHGIRWMFNCTKR